MARKRFRKTKNSVNSKRLKGSGLKALRVITSSPEEEDFRGCVCLHKKRVSFLI